MAHQRPPKEPIFKFRIPVPENPDTLRAYLDLGWLQLPGGIGAPPHLYWSHARGSPVHPGSDNQRPGALELINTLPPDMICMAKDSLASAELEEPKFREVSVQVRIRFARKYQGGRRGPSYAWVAEGADMRLWGVD